MRPIAILLACAGLLAAEESEPPPRWATTGTAGVFGSSVVASNQEDSRDPAINGSTETYSFRLSLEAGLDFRSGAHSADQDLVARFGRKKDAGEEWIENTDEVRYDGVYRYTFAKPHFTYGSWGWESVFTSPEPDHAPFSPGLAKAAAGYGQLYEGFWEESVKLEVRLGVAGRQRYGSGVSAAEGEAQVGLESYVRMEHVIDQSLRWYAQFEAFSEFADPAHLTSLGTAGLTAQIARFLSAELGLRVYYESAPEDAEPGATGYDRASLRQDTLLGLVYTW